MFVVSHFLNEELLLPYWLRHHLPIFDHGIMIDYGSTDNSVDIIRTIAPHWEIKKTRNKRFVEPDISNEVRSIESEIPANTWKIALNTTEFIVCEDLRLFVRDFQRILPTMPGFKMNGVIMVDSAEEDRCDLTDAPLVLQRRYGVVERPGEVNIVCCDPRKKDTPSRCRFMHKLKRAPYLPGRHEVAPTLDLREIDIKFGTVRTTLHEESRLAWTGVCPGIYIAWFGRYSPFLRVFRERTASFDFCVPRYSFVDWLLPVSPNDTSILEKEIVVVRQRCYNLWKREPLYHSAIMAMYPCGRLGGLVL